MRRMEVASAGKPHRHRSGMQLKLHTTLSIEGLESRAQIMEDTTHHMDIEEEVSQLAPPLRTPSAAILLLDLQHDGVGAHAMKDILRRQSNTAYPTQTRAYPVAPLARMGAGPHFALSPQVFDECIHLRGICNTKDAGPDE